MSDSLMPEPVYLFISWFFTIGFFFLIFHYIYHSYQTNRAAYKAQPLLNAKYNPQTVFKKYSAKNSQSFTDDTLLANQTL